MWQYFDKAKLPANFLIKYNIILHNVFEIWQLAAAFKKRTN